MATDDADDDDANQGQAFLHPMRGYWALLSSPNEGVLGPLVVAP